MCIKEGREGRKTKKIHSSIGRHIPWPEIHRTQQWLLCCLPRVRLWLWLKMQSCCRLQIALGPPGRVWCCLVPLLSDSPHWHHSSSAPLGRLLLKDSSWQVVHASVGDISSYKSTTLRTELQVTDQMKRKSGCFGGLERKQCRKILS